MQTEKNIRLIIAEDNQPMRQLIESYLSLFPQIQIVGSVSNGQEVLELLEQESSTAVFLDIEMPDLNGLAAAAKIREIQPNVFIIFVTAHTQYAAEAFQLEATDCLIKPISKESLERAINRIEKYLRFNNHNKIKKPNDLLVIKNKSESYIIHPNRIFFIEKQIKKTVIHSENGNYIISETLNVLKKKLNNDFFRCHKGFIANINKIEKIIPIAERIYSIHFYNYSLKATMGRKKLEQLYQIIDNVEGGI